MKPEPIIVRLIAPAAPPAATTPKPPPPQATQRKSSLPLAPPLMPLTTTPSTQAVSITVDNTEAPDQAPVHTTTLSASSTATAAPAATTGPKQLPPSAVRYLIEPQVNVPLLSRRLGESGLVHLRIVVDARGHLKEASLKKSAGFARLDQQALQDIRSARFAPYLENGQAVEWETVALLSYEIER